MSRRFRREMATRVEDMPHQFEPDQARAAICDLCGTAGDDARHVAWQRLESASRETAAREGLVREFG